MSFKDEIITLKADFSSLQAFLKERLVSMEGRIKEMEMKMSRNDNGSPECRFHDNNQREPAIDSSNVSNQEVDNKTRNIIEELMWESTLSEAVLHVRETFKDPNSREKFLRCSLELVLEKDEQYRKMTGTLFGFLINQNIVSPTNVFNSLSSVLLVIENSNNYNTQMWQNLTEILLPIITDSHIKLSQLQRKAHTIMKQDYFREFISHLQNAIEGNRKKLKTGSGNKSEYYPPSINLEPQTRDFKVEVQPPNNTNCMDLQNMYELDSIAKCLDTEPIPKFDVESLLDNLSGDNLDEAVRQLKNLSINDLKNAVEEIVDMGVQKDHEQRIVIGTLLAITISQDVLDTKQLLTSFYKSVQKVERLILNQKTRCGVCEAYADIVGPLFSNNKIKFDNLSSVASLILSEETKTIFLWSMEKVLNEKGIRTETQPITNGSPKSVSNKMLKRFVKYMGGRSNIEKESIGNSMLVEGKTKIIPERAKPADAEIVRPTIGNDEKMEDRAEYDKFLSMKRKKLLKERIENIGDKVDANIDDTASEQHILSRRTQEGDTGDVQVRADGQEAEVELPPFITKQPENLPSSAIKEKMEEIIEICIQLGNMDESVSMIRDTFNECQTDLVFKAAFEYTKDKNSNYRIQCGRLISEAFKHDSKRIGAQIMNTISLELGDYVDTPDLWIGMAEIITPPMINGIIRFNDLKLLPKYFLHTNHCASLLLALFKQIIHHKGRDWLEENWKKSKVDLSMFLPVHMCYKFIMDNDLQFCVKDEELLSYKENAG